MNPLEIAGFQIENLRRQDIPNDATSHRRSVQHALARSAWFLYVSLSLQSMNSCWVVDEQSEPRKRLTEELAQHDFAQDVTFLRSSEAILPLNHLLHRPESPQPINWGIDCAVLENGYLGRSYTLQALPCWVP